LVGAEGPVLTKILVSVSALGFPVRNPAPTGWHFRPLAACTATISVFAGTWIGKWPSDKLIVFFDVVMYYLKILF